MFQKFKRTVAQPEQDVVKQPQRDVPNILVFTDPGNDYDDLMALMILGYYHKLKQIKIVGVVITLAPVLLRARLAHGLFQQMGIRDVEIACGTKGTEETPKEVKAKSWEEYSLNAPFLAKKNDFKDYLDLCGRVIESAMRNNQQIRVLAIASLRDLASVFRKYPNFSNVVSQFHMQGGCVVDRMTYILGPTTARNNTYDIKASTEVYKAIQQSGKLCIVYDKEAALKSLFPKLVFDPAAKELRNKNMKSVASYVYRIHDAQKEQYYETSLLPAGQRHQNYMDRGWYIKYNTLNLPKRLEEGPCKFKALKEYTAVTPYDPIAALGCIEDVTGFTIPKAPVTTVAYSVGANLTEADGARIAATIQELLARALRIN